MIREDIWRIVEIVTVKEIIIIIVKIVREF